MAYQSLMNASFTVNAVQRARPQPIFVNHQNPGDRHETP